MSDRNASIWQQLLAASYRLTFRRVGAKLKLNKTVICCCLALAIGVWLLLSFRAVSTTTHRKVEKTSKNNFGDSKDEPLSALLLNNKPSKILQKAEVSETVSSTANVHVVNPHNYRYLINEEHRCSHHGPRHFFDPEPEKEQIPDSSPYRDIYLLVSVSSSPMHQDRRLAIRQAWANAKVLSRFKVVVIFLMGSTSSASQQMMIERESEMFHDIIQEDFVDSYHNLSIKSVMGLKWAATYCPSIAYYMKADDDVYINIELLVNFLKIYGQMRWIGGCIKQLKSPKPIDTFGQPINMKFGHPNFVAGAGYVLSGDIVAELYQSSLQRPIVQVEDAFITGYCAKAIGIEPSHYDGFSCGEAVTDNCQMKIKYVGHHVTTERQFQIWKTVHDSKNSCPLY